MALLLKSFPVGQTTSINDTSIGGKPRRLGDEASCAPCSQGRLGYVMLAASLFYCLSGLGRNPDTISPVGASNPT